MKTADETIGSTAPCRISDFILHSHTGSIAGRQEMSRLRAGLDFAQGAFTDTLRAEVPATSTGSGYDRSPTGGPNAAARRCAGFGREWTVSPPFPAVRVSANRKIRP